MAKTAVTVTWPETAYGKFKRLYGTISTADTIYQRKKIKIIHYKL